MTELNLTDRVYIINAVDESWKNTTYGKWLPNTVIPEDVHNWGGFLQTIELSIDSRRRGEICQFLAVK